MSGGAGTSAGAGMGTGMGTGPGPLMGGNGRSDGPGGTPPLPAGPHGQIPGPPPISAPARIAGIAAALRAPGALRPEGLPEGLVTPPGTDAARRFAIYRAGVSGTLAEALEAGFPVTARLLGARFFAAMARDFVRAHPPRSPVLALYGHAFPGWLAGFSPVSGLPYLPEVARIELALRRSCHAADAPPLDPALLADRLPGLIDGPAGPGMQDGTPPGTGEPPGDGPGHGYGRNPAISPARAALRPVPHPSARVVVTRWPALSIWARNSARPDLAQAPAGEVLVCRPGPEVTLRPAPPGTGAFLDALARGMAFGTALEAALGGGLDASSGPAAPPPLRESGALLGCVFAAGALTAAEDARAGHPGPVRLDEDRFGRDRFGRDLAERAPTGSGGRS